MYSLAPPLANRLVLIGLLGALLPIAAQAAPTPAPSQETVSVDVLQAEKLSGSGDNKAALALLDRYLTQHPGDARALVDRGDVYEDLGNERSAIADYTAAIAVNPEYAYAYASRCESRWEIDQNRDALADCDKAVELESEDGLRAPATRAGGTRSRPTRRRPARRRSRRRSRAQLTLQPVRRAVTSGSRSGTTKERSRTATPPSRWTTAAPRRTSIEDARKSS